MKRIGLLGGMSWESTIEYYRLSTSSSPSCSAGCTRPTASCAASTSPRSRCCSARAAGPKRARGSRDEAQALEAAGAELLVLCTNTMHKLAAEIELAITIPFVHIADTTAAAVRGDGLDRVGLLATAYTMEQDFYTGRLGDTG